MRALLLIIMISSSMFSLLNAQSLVFYTEEFPPYNYTENGVLQGASVELLHEVLALTGLRYIFHVQPWARVYHTAKTTQNTFLFTVNRNPEREDDFIWIGPILPRMYYVYALKPYSGLGKDLSDLHEKKIGVTLQDAMDVYFQSKGFNPDSELITLSGGDARYRLFSLLQAQRIDYWPAEQGVASFILSKKGFTPNEVLHTVFALDELNIDGYYLVANKNTSPAIIEKVQQALLEFQDSPDYKKLLERWNLLTNN